VFVPTGFVTALPLGEHDTMSFVVVTELKLRNAPSIGHLLQELSAADAACQLHFVVELDRSCSSLGTIPAFGRSSVSAAGSRGTLM
jgi:hypothetical protein